MFEKFYKYQSLGNDFIVFDCYQENLKNVLDKIAEKQFGDFVQKICDRHFGIGADNVLVLIKNQDLINHEVIVFNSDGSRAETCLNGLRCISLHLSTKHSFYQDSSCQNSFCQNFKIKMHKRIFEARINDDLTITNKTELGDYQGNKSIKVLDRNLTGHVVNVGNPHFIVLEKIDLNFLKQNGNLIENHKDFTSGTLSSGTNVEFIWQDKKDLNKFHMLVHERGCGITLACGSGAVAVLTTLFFLKKIKKQQDICISMLGGDLVVKVDDQNKIILNARAKCVFTGVL